MITPVLLCKSISPPECMHMHTCMHMSLWLTRLFVAFLWPKQANAACLRLYAPSHPSPHSNQPHREREREGKYVRSRRQMPGWRSVEQMKREGERWSCGKASDPLSLPNTHTVSLSHTPSPSLLHTCRLKINNVHLLVLKLESINRCYKC